MKKDLTRKLKNVSGGMAVNVPYGIEVGGDLKFLNNSKYNLSENIYTDVQEKKTYSK